MNMPTSDAPLTATEIATRVRAVARDLGELLLQREDLDAQIATLREKVAQIRSGAPVAQAVEATLSAQEAAEAAPAPVAAPEKKTKARAEGKKRGRPAAEAAPERRGRGRPPKAAKKEDAPPVPAEAKVAPSTAAARAALRTA